VTEPAPFPQQPSTSAGETGVDLRDPAVLLSLFVPALIGLYLLLTSTTSLIPGIWPYDAKRILQFGLLFILFLVPALNLRIRGEFGALLSSVPRWLRFTLLAVFAWGVLSALINAQSLMHALNSLSEVALLATLVLGVFVVAACRQVTGRRFDWIAIGLVALTGLTVGVQELLGVAASHSADLEFNSRISLLHFSFPRFYNQFQSWTVPTLVALPLLFARNRLAAILCLIVLGLQWYIILATGARGSFVSISAAIVFALIFLPPVRSRLLKWQITGFMLGALIFATVMFSFGADNETKITKQSMGSSQHAIVRAANREAGDFYLSGGEGSFFRQSVGRPMTHTSGRSEMWRSTIRDARNHPLFGIGPMNYACTQLIIASHPHNFPLQLAGEWGIPVALAVCFIFLFLAWRISRSVRQDESGGPKDTIFAGLLFTGVLAAATHACLSGILVMPASQVTGLLICGMLLGLYTSAPSEGTSRTLHWNFIPGLILTICLLGLGAYELQTMKSRAELLKLGAAGWPRIWQDAKVCTLYTVQNEGKN
jgi:putative inorganic carbon (HCO3(-)) transporter